MHIDKPCNNFWAHCHHKNVGGRNGFVKISHSQFAFFGSLLAASTVVPLTKHKQVENLADPKANSQRPSLPLRSCLILCCILGRVYSKRFWSHIRNGVHKCRAGRICKTSRASENPAHFNLIKLSWTPVFRHGEYQIGKHTKISKTNDHKLIQEDCRDFLRLRHQLIVSDWRCPWWPQSGLTVSLEGPKKSLELFARVKQCAYRCLIRPRWLRLPLISTRTCWPFYPPSVNSVVDRRGISVSMISLILLLI